MASKAVILVALVAAVVVMANAAEAENQSGRCRQQLMGGQWPNQCEDFFRQIMRRQRRHGGRYEAEMDNQGRGMYFDRCCEQLERMEPQCQCEAMEMMMDEMRSTMGGQMTREMVMSLPMMCGNMRHSCSMSM